MVKSYAIKTADGATVKLSETEDRTQLVVAICGGPSGGDAFEIVARLNREECDQIEKVLPGSFDYARRLECMEPDEISREDLAEALSVVPDQAA